MLDYYHRLARWLYAYRRALWLLCGVAVALFVLAVMFPAAMAGDRVVSQGAIVLLIWSICLLTVAYSFAAPPPAFTPDAGWFVRLKIRIRRSFLWLMALAMTMMTGLVIFVSYRIAAVAVQSLQG